MFVHYETCSTKHNDSNGKEVESCPWKHLQATTSISKYPPTSRRLILFFLQTAIALTHGFSSSAVSGPPCLLFCTKLAPLLEKKDETVIWDSSWTPNGLFFSMIQTQPPGSPQKRRQHCFFTPAVHWGTAIACVSFCICSPDPSWIFLKTVNNVVYTSVVRGKSILCVVQERNCTG